MEPHNHIISISGLHRSTGEYGTRMFEAYKGLDYDAPDFVRWNGSLHEKLYLPGQDLTAELGKAPHLERFFK